MRLLVLGGSGWLGGLAATAALARGHEVTCLSRGSAPPAGARHVVADRADATAYDGVAGPWDAVLDVSSTPGHVRRAVAALRGSTERYLYVSSGSVYAETAVPGRDESAPLLPALEADEMASMADYGSAKVACEEAVRDAFAPDGCLVARAGLIGGPGDASGRSGYWPWRFAHPADPDGRVLVPDSPTLATQLVDVRDLAAWLVAAAERGTTGTCNAVGAVVGLGELLATARDVAGHTGEVVRAAPAWLLGQGVAEWMGPRSLPCWLADPDWAGFGARDGSAAVAAGLVRRPLSDTLADTLAWEEGRAVPHGAGLTDEEERALLALLAG